MHTRKHTRTRTHAGRKTYTQPVAIPRQSRVCLGRCQPRRPLGAYISDGSSPMKLIFLGLRVSGTISLHTVNVAGALMTMAGSMNSTGI